MKNATDKPTIPLNLLSRESLLSANSDLILQLHDRLRAKRFRPQEGDALKLAYIRVFVQALQVQNAIMKDSELDEFKKRLEALEGTKGQLGGAPIYTPVFEAIE